MKYLCLLLLFLLGPAPSHGQERRPKFLEIAAHGKYQADWYTLLDGTLPAFSSTTPCWPSRFERGV